MGIDSFGKLGSSDLQNGGKLENFLTNGKFKISPDALESVFDGVKISKNSALTSSVFASNSATIDEQGITESSYSDTPSEKAMATTEEIEDMIQGMMGDFIKSVEDAVEDALQNGINNTDETNETESTSSASPTTATNGTEKTDSTKSDDSVNDKNNSSSIYDEIGKSKLNDDQRAAYEKYEKYLNEKIEEGICSQHMVNGREHIINGAPAEYEAVANAETKKEALLSMIDEMSDDELKDFLSAYEIMNEDDGGIADLFFQLISGSSIDGVKEAIEFRKSGREVVRDYEENLSAEDVKKLSRLTGLLSDKDKEKIMQEVFGDNYQGADGAGVLGQDHAVNVFAKFLNGEYVPGVTFETFTHSYVLAGITSRYL